MTGACGIITSAEPTDAEILEWTSDENMRHMRQSEELRGLIAALPDQVLFANGLHRQMMDWMTQYQQSCFLDYVRRDAVLCMYLNSGLDSEIREFIDGFADTMERYSEFQIMRDHSWDLKFDRPRDPLIFEPQPIGAGKSRRMQTLIKQRRIGATLQDYFDERWLEKEPVLRLKHRNSYGDDIVPYDNEIVQVMAEECVTPLADFCYPPDAKVTIGYRMDGRIDVKVFAKEMPGSPVLHWIFPDPKNHGLDPAYQDFLWWL